MPTLKIVQNGITKTVAFEGEKLLGDLLGHFDAHIDKPCGGRGACKKCTVIVNGKEELACRYIVRGDAEVVVPDNKDIVSATGANESGIATDNLCLCLDIGTTTLALALVSLDDKQIIKTKTAPNPQREFGADVISRIEYCAKSGVNELQSILAIKIKEMASELFAEYALKSVEKMYVAGNTTMLHLFFGVDCSSLGVSPYTPIFLEEKRAKGANLGFNNISEIMKEVNRIRTKVDLTSFEEMARYVCEEPNGNNILVELQVSTKWCRDNGVDDYIDIVAYEFDGELEDYGADVELETISFNGNWKTAIEQMKNLAMKVME